MAAAKHLQLHYSCSHSHLIPFFLTELPAILIEKAQIDLFLENISADEFALCGLKNSLITRRGNGANLSMISNS